MVGNKKMFKNRTKNIKKINQDFFSVQIRVNATISNGFTKIGTN